MSEEILRKFLARLATGGKLVHICEIGEYHDDQYVSDTSGHKGVIQCVRFTANEAV